MNDLPILNTARCTLSRITMNDIFVMRQIFDDHQAHEYLSELYPLVETDGGIQRLISSFDSYLRQDDGMIWGIRLQEVLIGFVAFMDLLYCPTIIYAMHPDYRSKGYMKECLIHVIKYMFDHNYCRTIQTEVYNNNTASINLLISIGFMTTKQDKEKTYLRLNS